MGVGAGKKEKKRLVKEEERIKSKGEKEQKECVPRLNTWGEFFSRYLLTTSARNYVDSIGKKLSDFNLKFVDGVNVGRQDLEGTIFICKKEMVEKAEGFGAEVVVDMKSTIAYHKLHYQPVYMSGTALVPKE